MVGTEQLMGQIRDHYLVFVLQLALAYLDKQLLTLLFGQVGEVRNIFFDQFKKHLPAGQEEIDVG